MFAFVEGGSIDNAADRPFSQINDSCFGAAFFCLMAILAVPVFAGIMRGGLEVQWAQ